MNRVGANSEGGSERDQIPSARLEEGWKNDTQSLETNLKASAMAQPRDGDINQVVAISREV